MNINKLFMLFNNNYNKVKPNVFKPFLSFKGIKPYLNKKICFLKEIILESKNN